MKLLIILCLSISTAFGDWSGLTGLDSLSLPDDLNEIISKDAEIGEVISSDHLNKKLNALNLKIDNSSLEIMFVDVGSSAPASTSAALANTNYSIRELFSISNDIFGSLVDESIELPVGKYLLQIPIFGYYGAAGIFFRLYNETHSLVIKDWDTVVAAPTDNSFHWNTISYPFELTETTRINFQTKSWTAAGQSGIGDFIIIKY